MSVTTLAGGRKATHSYLLLALIAGAVLGLGLADALAQNPFARRVRLRSAAGGDGIAGWLIAKQAEFYRLLSGAIRNAKTDGGAVWVLMGLSFAYGIFHAAGPGHGKAVISSYLVANQETWKARRRAVVCVRAVQALVAVSWLDRAALLGATAKTMNNAVGGSRLPAIC